MLRLTVDTNCVDNSALRAAAVAAGAEVAAFAVSRREVASTSFAEYLQLFTILPDQSVFADGFWADDFWAERFWQSGPDVSYQSAGGRSMFGDPFEDILKAISNGAFPPPEARRVSLLDRVVSSETP